jgi:predicted RNA-binding Zn-ribbon protein involved in translation (DUF1610 family)
VSGAQHADGQPAADGGLREVAPPEQHSGERQVPFYCPYCGDEDLRPAGPAGGSWRCAACARAFELRFAGIAPVAGGGLVPDRDGPP